MSGDENVPWMDGCYSSTFDDTNVPLELEGIFY